MSRSYCLCMLPHCSLSAFFSSPIPAWPISSIKFSLMPPDIGTCFALSLEYLFSSIPRSSPCFLLLIFQLLAQMPPPKGFSLSPNRKYSPSHLQHHPQLSRIIVSIHLFWSSLCYLIPNTHTRKLLESRDIFCWVQSQNSAWNRVDAEEIGVEWQSLQGCIPGLLRGSYQLQGESFIRTFTPILSGVGRVWGAGPMGLVVSAYPLPLSSSSPAPPYQSFPVPPGPPTLPVLPPPLILPFPAPSSPHPVACPTCARPSYCAGAGALSIRRPAAEGGWRRRRWAWCCCSWPGSGQVTLISWPGQPRTRGGIMRCGLVRDCPPLYPGVPGVLPRTRYWPLGPRCSPLATRTWGRGSVTVEPGILQFLLELHSQLLSDTLLSALSPLKQIFWSSRLGVEFLCTVAQLNEPRHKMYRN